MTICPCCGFKFEGTLSKGCEACGARSVGEPLPKPDHELPSYARSLLITVAGTLMVLALLTETIIALAKRVPLSFSFLAWLKAGLAAGESAAWRVKWVAIPVTILVLWGMRRIYRSMLSSPARFCGMRYAKAGFRASATVSLLIAVLIGITVPERLRQRQLAIEAGTNALARTFDRAILQYRLRFERVPNEPNDLRQLPDPDGSIAAALKSLPQEIYPTAYKPSADVASKQKPQPLRGVVIRNASLTTTPDDTLADGLSFTNYELTLPGPDMLLGTEDDLIMRDGVITKAADTKRPIPSTASTKTTKP